MGSFAKMKMAVNGIPLTVSGLDCIILGRFLRSSWNAKTTFSHLIICSVGGKNRKRLRERNYFLITMSVWLAVALVRGSVSGAGNSFFFRRLRRRRQSKTARMSNMQTLASLVGDETFSRAALLIPAVHLIWVDVVQRMHIVVVVDREST